MNSINTCAIVLSTLLGLQVCNGQMVAPAPAKMEGSGAGPIDPACYDMGTDGMVVFGDERAGIRGRGADKLKRFSFVNEAYCMEKCAEDPLCTFISINTDDSADWSCMTFPATAAVINSRKSIITIGKVQKSALTGREGCIKIVKGGESYTKKRKDQQLLSIGGIMAVVALLTVLSIVAAISPYVRRRVSGGPPVEDSPLIAPLMSMNETTPYDDL